MISPYAYRTYRMHSPDETHYRKATCAEVKCNEFINGWSLQVEHLNEHDLYLATHAGKRYRKAHFGPGLNFLIFESGQSCFLAHTHKIKLDRPEWFFTGRGDHTVFSQRDARQLSGKDWVDHMLNHMDKIITKKNRG